VLKSGNVPRNSVQSERGQRWCSMGKHVRSIVIRFRFTNLGKVEARQTGEIDETECDASYLYGLTGTGNHGKTIPTIRVSDEEVQY
jgi:hypothetical protein